MSNQNTRGSNALTIRSFLHGDEIQATVISRSTCCTAADIIDMIERDHTGKNRR